ncbi:MAG: T9SS type A sorting domain-containing protein, partial [Bacteroidales bacterium]|nr:T9SS type A sorting domain-containing protein [Bacteroidales bacterium]
NAVLQEQVSLRPNPATTRVQVASPVAMTRIVVTDLQGRTLLELPVTADTAEFDTSTWPRGTVIVTIHTAQGKAVKKLALK